VTAIFIRAGAGFLLLAAVVGPAAAQTASPSAPAAQTSAQPPSSEPPVRDPVGDLNADDVKAGDFPGSFLVPGPGGVSLGIGGFVKALFFTDSNIEGRESVFLPALIGGMGRDDEDGTTSLNAELTRLNFDARVTAGEQKMRGYVEFDFSGDLFKWRHGYITWSGAFGEVTAGKTWSTMMDLQSIPDGLGEPTVSGLIFTRQALFRYSRQASKGVRLAVAIEDSASNDVQAAEKLPTRTGYPDLVGSVNLGSTAHHVAVSGVLRSIDVDPDAIDVDAATGWGVNIGAHTMLGKRDRLYGAFAFGEGLGRYLVGVVPAAAAFVEPDTYEISVRENAGGFVGLRHQWNGTCRSSVVYSRAEAETDPRQPANAFESSQYVLGNLLCKANRFLTIGVEYDYGTRGNKDGRTLDNHRVMVGMQLF
jgi:hypothetical protein